MSPLTSIVLTPLITALIVLLIPGNYRFVLRLVAIAGASVTAVLATRLFFLFQPGGGLQFDHQVPWLNHAVFSLSYHVGADGLNIGLILAAALVGFAAVGVSWDIERQPKLYYFLLLLIIGGALGAFASLDLFFFYFFNELALVPTFIMIGLWGRGPEKNYAAFKITIYLTLGAMIALVGLILVYAQTQTLDVVKLRALIATAPLPSGIQSVAFPCLLFGFGTLVGLWPFHSWAPLGYASAPTATAMMHAGILKKAGLLALLRVALPLMPEGVAKWMPVLLVLGLGNLLYCGFVAMRQRDLNLLLGNSSLAHMGFCFLGIASVSVIGVTGTVLVMVSHALLAALSFAVSGWFYRHAGTLELNRFGGVLARVPFFGTVLIAALMAGCGVPGFANFAGEVTVMFGAWKQFPWFVMAAAWGGLVIGGVYMLRAIREMLHGELNPEFAALREFPHSEPLPEPLPNIGLGAQVVTWLTWLLNSALGGGIWRGWRRLPYVVLLASLLLFGFAPGILTERIRPAAEELVKLATNRVPTTAVPPATEPK
jgi:NADH-quinone oxidoreductase subunit M